ncbi:carbohydrate-binding module family 13 protein [Thelephora ganbajun]|uniref:Carbohydrate-binding module family 13 protein n=1 Tax=Thelephora ganbajun TaxID=370292 RepID=A0ACB6ZGN2_THEGA|nr:carbohydrate-binding module family 13 protein [Thelephora ganbajun]
MEFGGQVFYIINKKSGTAMDLNATNQIGIIGWKHHGGDNQKWMIVPNLEDVDGSCWIENVAFKKYLSIERSPENGVKLIASSTKFLWNLRNDEGNSDAWRFFVPGTEQNADLANHGDPTSGTDVVLWYHTQGQNQVWYLRPV